MKKPYITVSNENIHLIAYRLKQFIYRMGTIAQKSIYPSTVKKVSLLGKGKHDITESMIAYLSSSDFTLEVDTNYPDFGDKFIRLNYQKNCNGRLITKGCNGTIIHTSKSDTMNPINNNIKEDYCSLEVSKLLKERGCTLKERTAQNSLDKNATLP
jgi:hypothetical protein